MGFCLVPFRQPNPPTRFLHITDIGMCHFLPVHHFGMACLAGSKVNIQHLHPAVRFQMTNNNNNDNEYNYNASWRPVDIGDTPVEDPLLTL